MESSEQHVSPRFVAVNGQHLRQLRMERGMTQLQLARAAGYTERLIRKAEKSGRLDIATIHDLAEALSQSGENVSLGHLLHDNLAIARLWVQSFSEHDHKMLALVRPYVSEDFVFYCPGDTSTTRFAGTFKGVSGFQKWLNLYFEVFSRHEIKELEFHTGPDTVVARWKESCSLRGIACGPIRFSMYFRFQEGVIVRIENDYDTKAFEDAILNALKQLRGLPGIE